VIRLVEHDKHMIGNGHHEAVDRFLPDHGSGRIVGIGNEDGACLRRDRGQHGVEISRVPGIGHFDRIRAEKLGHELVHGEGVTSHHHLVTRAEKGMADELDDLVGAVAEHDVFPHDSESLRDGTAQFISSAIRIEVGALQRASHRLERLGRWAEGVLVGGELDDLLLAQAEIAGQLLNRFARLVDG